jgi:rhodanese-related sulfurtransferase
MLRGDHPQTDVESAIKGSAQGEMFLLDVRTPEEFSRGTIPGAMNIPVDELRRRIDELPRNKTIAAFCQVGQRGYLATRILLQAGIRVINVSGGYQTFCLLGSKRDGVQ